MLKLGTEKINQPVNNRGRSMPILEYLKRSYVKKMSVSMLIIMLMSVLLYGCGSDKKPGLVAGSAFMRPQTTAASQDEKEDNIFTGILLSLDKDNKKMVFADADSGNEIMVDYTGGTDIKNKYNAVISASQMQPGEIFKVVQNKDRKLTSIYGDKDAWEVSGVTGFSADESKNEASFGGKNYKYNNHAVVFSGENRITLDQIMKQDVVTVRGNGDRIYALILEKGHGYLKLTGYQAFVGGYADIGTKLILPVTQNMVITAPEGDYKVSLQLGKLRGVKTVTIEKDKDTVLDFSEYKQEEVKTGSVLFSVTPQDAVLYLDGEQVDYSKELQLTYGNHSIVLKANYYTPYSETFVVNSPYEKKIYDLVRSSGTDTTSSPESSKQSETQAKASTEMTAGYKININGPEGAAVYVDSIYMGIAPVSFSKSPGNKVITFSEAGKDTKSYTISVPDAAGDMDYKFPDM